MDTPNLTNAAWRKSSWSSGNGQCVEVAFVGKAVAMRDSKDPDGPALVFAGEEFHAFLGAVANGEFGQP